LLQFYKKKMDKIKGILFDLDGVLVENKLNFRKISREIFEEERLPLLENISRIKNPLNKKRAYAILEKHETGAATTCRLKEGVPQLFQLLNQHGIKKGIVTRNSRKSADIIIKRFGLTFDAIVTREDAPPKPARDPIILACKKMELSTNEIVFLGDYEFDMIAGRKANVFTVLLKSHSQPYSQYADLVVESIADFTHYVKDLLKIS